MQKIGLVLITIVLYSLIILPTFMMESASAEIVVNNSEENKPGTISLLASSTVPEGYLLCDGRAVSRTTYSALFAVIGTTAGAGDGSTTFNLPNMQGKTTVGKNSGTFNTLGKTGGSETQTLTTANLPAHSHTLSSGTVSTKSLTGNFRDIVYQEPTYMGSAWGVISKGVGWTEGEYAAVQGREANGDYVSGGIDGLYLDASHNHTLSGSTSSVGSTTAHNNLQPYITLNYVIKY